MLAGIGNTNTYWCDWPAVKFWVWAYCWSTLFPAASWISTSTMMFAAGCALVLVIVVVTETDCPWGTEAGAAVVPVTLNVSGAAVPTVKAWLLVFQAYSVDQEALNTPMEAL